MADGHQSGHRVAHNLLGNRKYPNWQQIIRNLLQNYCKIGATMSLKSYFLHFHLDFFETWLSWISYKVRANLKKRTKTSDSAPKMTRKVNDNFLPIIVSHAFTRVNYRGLTNSLYLFGQHSLHIEATFYLLYQ